MQAFPHFPMHSPTSPAIPSLPQAFHQFPRHFLTSPGITSPGIPSLPQAFPNFPRQSLIFPGNPSLPQTFIHFPRHFFNCLGILSFIHSFISAISIAPLQVLYYSEALPTTARILYRSFTPKRTGNCRQRTCPRSVHGG